VSAPVDRDDPTRTTGPESEGDDTLASSSRSRRPAPLQYRDHERYLFEGEHGRGGLGRVLKARDLELGRPVAIKELLQRTHTSELRFYQEALITSRLEHPNIVPVHEAGRWSDGTPFYSMKLVAGRSLRELVEAAKTPAARYALIPHVASVAEAIAYAHSRGVIHRDIKPSNVVIGEFGETIVIDWGLAKYVDDSDEARKETLVGQPTSAELTAVGAVVGTPAYMSPEQARSESGMASDVYSIGAMLFNVVTGRLPSSSELSDKHRWKGRLPSDVEAVIRRATAVKPSDRYDSAVALAADIRRYIRREPVEARTYGVAARAVLLASKHQTLSFALLLFFTVVSAILGVAVTRVERERGKAAKAGSEATAARAVAEERLADAVLSQAQTLLGSDPARAAELLQGYRGADLAQASLLTATAVSLGGDAKVLQIHRDSVHVLERSGANNMVSWGLDGSLALTGARGNVLWKTDRALRSAVPSFAPSADVVAFVHDSSVVRVRQLRTGRESDVTADTPITDVALSADASVLAVVGAGGRVTVWRNYKKSIVLDVGARWVLVPNNDTVVAGKGGDVFAASLTANEGSSKRTMTAKVISAEIDLTASVLSVGLANGRVAALSARDLAVMREWNVCSAEVRSLHAATGGLAFGCADGKGGVIDSQGRVEFYATCHGACSAVALAPSAEYLVAGDSSGTIQIVDKATGVTRVLRGHQAPITTVLLPSESEPYIATADAKGEIRKWPVHASNSQVVASLPGGGTTAAFTVGGEYLVVGGRDEVVYVIGTQGDTCQSLAETHGSVLKVVVGERFVAALGLDGDVAAWEWPTLKRYDTFDRTTPITDIDRHGDDMLMTSDYEGVVGTWQPATNASATLWNAQQPIVSMDAIPRSGGYAASTLNGEAWVSSDGATRGVAGPVSGATFVRASPGGEFVVFGRTSGDLLFVKPGWQNAIEFFRMPAAIFHMEVSPNSKYLAVTTEGDSLALFRMTPFPHLVFLVGQAASRRVLFDTSSRVLAATGTDGSVRFYDVASKAWQVRGLHSGRVQAGAFSPDDPLFASVGQNGRVVLTDTNMVFNDPAKCGLACGQHVANCAIQTK
jgi:WD40 repeat protein